MMKKRMKRIRDTGADLFTRYGWKAPLAALSYAQMRRKLGMGYGEFRAIGHACLSRKRRASFLGMEEYFKRCYQINPQAKLKVLRDKRTVITRLPHYLGRECLIADYSDAAAFLAFVEKHGAFYAKKNFSTGGVGTRVFRDIHTQEERMRAYALCKEEELVIIEQFIPQHPALSALYPHVVNTIRMHTARGPEGIQLPFLPELCVPFGGERNSVHTARGLYKIFIDPDSGRLWEKAFYRRYPGILTQAETHRDTGAAFGQVVIPYWEEAKAMVRDAATYIPELAFIGWDVGITPEGPVIIEGNAISGALKGYQIQMAFLNGGYGVRQEYEAMFALAEKALAAGKQN